MTRRADSFPGVLVWPCVCFFFVSVHACVMLSMYSTHSPLPLSPCVVKVDIVIHSLANGPEVTKPLLETSRRGYLAASSASAYSMVSLVQSFAPIMPKGGSVVSLTYIASEKVRGCWWWLWWHISSSSFGFVRNSICARFILSLVYGVVFFPLKAPTCLTILLLFNGAPRLGLMPTKCSYCWCRINVRRLREPANFFFSHMM